MSRRVVIAMSGGVDSSVCAALLKEAGFDVVGVMMKFWKEGADGKNRCCSVESEKLARLVAKKIGIPFYVVNAEKEFKKKVVDYFIKEYKAGRTPNPCVVCNKQIKFGLLIEKALKMGADYIATGHYARISLGNKLFIRMAGALLPSASRPNPPKSSLPRLIKGKDAKKDQSYFLWQLNQKQLARVLFPVGGYTKQQVRQLAKEFDLPVAETPESQEVCFVQNTTNEFLSKYLKTKPGKIVDMAGKAVGRHTGLWFYTIGQRKALGLAQGPWFVVEKDFKRNILVVSKNKKDLLRKEMLVKNVNWILPPAGQSEVDVKIRYKSKLAKAKIFKAGTDLKVVFARPQASITAGQSAVFYLGSQLLGGGIIK